MSMNSIAVPDRAPPAQACTAPLRFLVVDDDRTNRLVLQAMLMQDGHVVLQAEDGLMAAEMFEREQPDMVLMDVMMPRLDGYESARRIKQSAGERFLPVIFLTALTDEQSLARCIEAGGDDFLSKPISRTLLRAKIRALQRTRDLYLELQRQRAQLATHAAHLENEQTAAERVFAGIVHRGCLDDAGIKYLISPMALFNGDLLLAARRPSGDLLVLLGDFTGHGLPAAVGAVPTAEIFYVMAAKGCSIGDIVAEINRKLKLILPPEQFLAACLAGFDASGRSVAVWNGGIPDVLVSGPRQEGRCLPSRHLPLGIVGNEQLDRSVEIIEVAHGDRLYLYSDGLIEARNPAGDMFGEERLRKAVGRGSGNPDTFGDLCAALDTFRGGDRQRDDLTLIEITCAARPVRTSDMPSAPARNRSAGVWRFDFELGVDALKAVDPLPPLVEMVTDLQGLDEHRERVYLVISELFNNALDHGLLRLDSSLKARPEGFLDYYARRGTALAALREGRIAVRLRHAPHGAGGDLHIEVEDSGPGFDHAGLGDSLEDNRAPSGRGVSLVRRLCVSLTYRGNGNCVEAVYRWS